MAPRPAPDKMRVEEQIQPSTTADRLGAAVALIPKVVIAALLIFAMLDLLVGVFLRYVVVAVTDYFDLPTVNFFWVEEVGELALAWLTAIGAAVAIIERTHFVLSILTHRLSARAQAIIERLNHVLIAAFGVLAAVYGFRLSLINSVLTTPGLEINLAWLYASSVAGGALIAIYGLGVAAGVLRPRLPHDVEGI
jgi:TRAP-type C4-dicarboxylate transport system permease small subunit